MVEAIINRIASENGLMPDIVIRIPERLMRVSCADCRR
jgi:hypothetical protein